MRLLCFTLLLCSPLTATAQSVATVDLGVTSVRALMIRRGPPPDTGIQNSGWHYVSYARRGVGETFYFSPSDSIVQWVRILPEPGRSAARVHEAFGPPDTTTFGDDLAKLEIFKHGTIVVRFTDSNTVSSIDYYPEPEQQLGFRRARRAATRVDNAIAPLIFGIACRTKKCPAFDKAVDSAGVLRGASARVRSLIARGQPVPPELRTASDVFDSLCTLSSCQQIYRDAKAYDDTP